MKPRCYTLTVLDSYGDGMDAGFGVGSYSIIDQNGMRWGIRKVGNTQLRIDQKRRAHIEAGMEYIFDSHVKASNLEEAASKRVTFISPTVGVFHPIYERFLIGVKYKRNFKTNPKMNN